MDINVAFWNLGNLFDTADDPVSDDFDFTAARGWTPATQQAKARNLAAVIDAMFAGTGPDLLGVCEVENEPTLQQLLDAVTVRSDLRILAFDDGPDVRGIDCALVFSDRKFQPFAITDPEPPAPRGHVVHNRYPTRDIFEAALRVLGNGAPVAELLVYVNHWPSRRQGRYETEPLRVAAANHLGRLIDRRLKFSRRQLAAMPDTAAAMAGVQARWNRNVLVMGDFNDEPFSRSVPEELGASSGLDQLEEPVKRSGGNQHLPDVVKYAQLQAPLFNCMWPVSATPDRGSLFFGGGTPTMNVLDQFIVSRGLYYGLSGLRLKRRSRLEPGVQPTDPPLVVPLPTVAANVFDADLMITSPQTRRPKGFTFEIDGAGHASHNNGFSDHLPIVTTIETFP
jgi:hypothetical protein